MRVVEKSFGAKGGEVVLDCGVVFGAWFWDKSVLSGGSNDTEGPLLLLIPLLSRPGSLPMASVIPFSPSALLMHSHPACWQPRIGVYLEN